MCGRANLPRRSFLIVLGAFLTGCGGPITPQTLGPVLVCPANVTLQSPDGNAAPVVYDPPQVIAGEPPLRTTCSPLSGAIFLLGQSTVTCTTTDAVARTGSCAFTVTLTVPPHISATSFMAFGNSITEGKDASGNHLPNNYPEDLRSLLATRYSAQAAAITMANRGSAGEYAATGASRLVGELDAVRPAVLLLEEGVNDLGGGDPNAIAPMADSLRQMVREARGRGVVVFLGTLLPERTGGSRAGALSLLPAANDQIRDVAQSEGATLVDLFAGFGGNPDPYIDFDGLHPNAQGYQKMAQLFFDAIRANLEVVAVAPSSMELVRNMPAQHPPFTRLR